MSNLEIQEIAKQEYKYGFVTKMSSLLRAQTRSLGCVHEEDASRCNRRSRAARGIKFI